jgi:hypothetical protein
MIKKALTALVLAGAFSAAQADVLVYQGFDNVSAMPGWVMNNASTPGGITGWYQGDQTAFTAHSGAANSYVAANYNNAAAGGSLSNWLITPVFTTATGVSVTFWMRGANDPAYFDQVTFGFSSGSSAIADFSVSPTVTVGTDGWAMYTVNLAAQGEGATGRFAIQYTGMADNANYIGLDDLTVAAVPEPATMLVMAAGMLGLAATRRRRQRGE